MPRDDGAAIGELIRALERPENGPSSAELCEALDEEQRIAALAALKGRVQELAQSRPEEALGLAERTAERFGGSSRERTLALRIRAVAGYFADRPDRALRDYEACIHGYREIGERLEAARVQRSLVEIHLSLGHFQEALRCAAEARPVFEEEGREDLLAGLDLNLGNVHFRMDEYAAARERYAAAGSGFERLDDELGRAYADFSLANLEMAANRFEAARAGYRAAREVWDRHGSLARVADCDYSLAFLESRCGRFAEAIRDLEGARDIYRQGSKPSGEFYVDLDLAEIHFRLGGWRDALDLAERASAGFRELGFEYERARADALAGLARFRLGKKRAALEALEEAKATLRELGNRTQVAVIELQQAAVATADGRPEAQLPGLRRIRAELEDSGQELLVELATLALADALNSAGVHDEAERVLQPLTERMTGGSAITSLVAPELWRAHADALLGLGREPEARRALERAVAEVEGTYSTVPGKDLRVAFFRDRREAFCELAWLHLRDAGPDSLRESIDLLERSRMRSLVEGESGVREEAQAFDAARERVDELLNQQLDAEIGSWSGAAAAASSGPQRDELQAACDRLARLGRERGGLAAAGGRDADVLRAAARDGESLVYYFVDGRGARAFLADGGELEAIEIEVARVDGLRDLLALQFQKLRLGGAYLERQGARLRRATAGLLDELGECLLGPLAGRLAGRALVIVPYGPLHGIPFHALRLGGRHLIEDHEVSYAPSLTVLARARRASSTPGGRITAAWDVEESVPSARREIERLRELYGELCTALPSDDLRLRLPEVAATVRGLHLAAHGSFQPTHPLFSGVRLGSGFLTAYDVRSMPLDLDLVTLSGCETGRVARVAGEDLSGLQQAFFAAGVRCVVSALWPTVDRENAELMERFYEHLAAGRSVRAALTAAQRELLARGESPQHWAPFVVHGDPDVVLPAGVSPPRA